MQQWGYHHGRHVDENVIEENTMDVTITQYYTCMMKKIMRLALSSTSNRSSNETQGTCCSQQVSSITLPL